MSALCQTPSLRAGVVNGVAAMSSYIRGDVQGRTAGQVRTAVVEERWVDLQSSAIWVQVLTDGRAAVEAAQARAVAQAREEEGAAGGEGPEAMENVD